MFKIYLVQTAEIIFMQVQKLIFCKEHVLYLLLIKNLKYFIALLPYNNIFSFLTLAYIYIHNIRV